MPDPRPASEPWPTSGGPTQASPLVWLRQDSRPRAVRAADRATLRLSGQQAPPGPPEAGGRVLFPEYLQLQTPTYLASLCPSQSGRASLKPLTPTETQLRKSKVMRRLRGLVQMDTAPCHTVHAPRGRGRPLGGGGASQSQLVLDEEASTVLRNRVYSLLHGHCAQ